MASNIISFPHPVAKGRKRVARGLETGCGDLTLLTWELDGKQLPRNVARLALEDIEEADDGEVDRLLALTIFWSLPVEQKREIREQVRVIKYRRKGPGWLVAAAVALDRRITPTTMFIREEDGKCFDVRGEAL